MRLLFIGDVVGRSGRAAVLEQVPILRKRWNLDFVVVNGENAAGGFGLTEAIFDEFIAAGVDAVTLGNHAFDQREALVFIERRPRLVRPANYPAGTPGRGSVVVENANGARLLVVNLARSHLHGRARRPVRLVSTGSSRGAPRANGGHAVWSTCTPRRRAKNRRSAISPTDGPASSSGTHTHVPSADHRILPGGTGFVTDVGMTGDYDSVIGMDKEEPLRRFIRRIPSGRFEAALGPATLCGVAVEIDAQGRTRCIAPVRIGGLLSPAEPGFWN